MADPTSAHHAKTEKVTVVPQEQTNTTGNIVQGPGSALSVNQQGGITAAQVNLGIPNRHLTPEQKAAIASALKGKTCKVSSMGYELGAADARDFAFEIQAALRSGGCDVPEDLTPAFRKNGTNRGVFVQYYDPATYSPGEKFTVSPDTPQGMLIGTFAYAHLPVSAAPGPDVSKNVVEVIVGAP